MSFLGLQGEPDGFDVALIRALAARMGVAAGFVTVTTENKIPLLQSGQIDLIAPITQTVPREQAVDFSLPVVIDGQSLLVRSGDGIRGPSDLAGRRVAIHRGSLAGATLAALVPGAQIVLYDDYEAMARAVVSGDVTAATTGRTWCSAQSREHRGLEVTPGTFTRDVLALGLPRGDAAFRDTVDDALRSLWADGTVGTLYRRYLDASPPPHLIEPIPGFPR